jgi:glutamate/tyrosine decarboxylase-like PLP-dependent enzyme
MNERQRPSPPLLDLAARHAQAYLAEVGNHSVGATATPDQLHAALGGPFPETGDDGTRVIDALAAAAATGTVRMQGPRFFGFVVGGSLPVTTAADWLVSAWDQNPCLYVMSPLVSTIEDIAGSWIQEIAGLPPSWSIGYVTGCQMANFTALAAARHHVLAAAGWDVEARGVFGAPPVDVVIGDEAHYTILTALRMLGFGAERVHRVPADAQGRMRADEAARVLAGTDGPCIICAQAGNVNTGAFDPIDTIADAARGRNAWLHVDGAFGFWAAASPDLAALTSGMSQADSIATDAHKWLNVPYDCGLVLTAHADAHRRAMTLPAAYIQASASFRDPREFGPEESRRARAVPVYAALRPLGRSGLRDLAERSGRLARRMAAALAGRPHVRVLNDVVLNPVLVRYEPPDGGDADAFTKAVIARVQADGTCWLGGTVWHGMSAMRISISNWSTTEDDIDRSAEAILRAAGA